MLIREKKYTNKDLTFISTHLENCKNNFIILDDNSEKVIPDYKKIFNKIIEYGYDLTVLDSKQIINKIISYLEEHDLCDCFDSVILAGTGGKQMYEGIKNTKTFTNKEIISLTWHRVWNGEKSLGFETNINKYNFSNKKVIILEDVIASGNTLWTLKNTLESYGAQVIFVISALIQESSPIISKSFSNIYSGVMIKKTEDKTLNPFWYPPIYSLRHLMHGDDEMEHFYQILNEKYFNNEIEVEQLIKKYRREL